MDRKEAIEIVRKNYPHVGFSGSEFETALRELVPELVESEDERIRKAISYAICAAIHQDGTLINHVTKEEALAYLEKQKEQKYYTYEQSKQAAENCYYDKDYNTEDGGRCNQQSFLWGFEEGVNWCEQQKERKSVDLSEMMVHKEPYIAPVPTSIVADEQKPAEWSEEDERMFNSLCTVLHGGLSSIPTEQFISWLKFLRPQPHWKPSEGQMDAFEQMLCTQPCPNGVVAKRLTELENDLKKLI